MSNLSIIIPITLPPTHGFFISKEIPPPPMLLGFPASYIIKDGYQYLQLQNVPEDVLPNVHERVRDALKWAAVRLNMGMDTPKEEAKLSGNKMFDGQFATAYPDDVQPVIARLDCSGRQEEPVNRLFAALEEGASETGLANSPGAKKLRTAAEFFSATDFELTDNSKYLMLCTVLEVLADPKQRPTLCIYLVEGLIENVKKAKKTAEQEDDAETQEALQGLHEFDQFLEERVD